MQNLGLEAEKPFGIEIAEVEEIESGVVNKNFKVSSAKGEVFLLKIYRTKTVEELEYEKSLLQALQGSGLKVPSWKGWEIQKDKEGRPAVLYPFLEGSPERKLTPEQLSQVGSAIAQMHKALEGVQPLFDKQGWDEDALPELVERSKGEGIERIGEGFVDIVHFVEEEIGSYKWRTDLPKTLTHQDIKPENILFQNGKLSGFIDFDNAYFGQRIHDITTTAIWTCLGEKEGEFDQERLKALVDGYQSVMTLSQAEIEYFPRALAFRLLREIYISPYAAASKYELALERAQQFKHHYQSYKEKLGI